MSEQRERSGGDRRIELSLAQVVAGALAAVVGAVLASELGVYGTVAGAAVVSVGATCGGAVFHHLFRRTGEQLREVTERSPNRTVNGLRQVPVDPDPPAPRRRDLYEPVPDSSWHDSPVRRAGRRWSWKGRVAISVLVFVLAMAPIVTVELATGKNLHAITSGQDGGGTSILPGLTTGRSGGSAPERGPDPADRSAPPAARPSNSPSGSPAAAPSASPSGRGATSSAGAGPFGSPSASGSVSPSGGASAPATSGTPSAPPTADASGGPSEQPGAGGSAPSPGGTPAQPVPTPAGERAVPSP